MLMMMMLMVVMLGTTTYLISLVASVSEGEFMTSRCSLEQVANCTKDLDLLGQQIAPFYEIQELDSLCRKWNYAKPCLDHVVMTCESERENETEAIKTSEGIVGRKMAEQAATEWMMGYEYLCYDGKMSYSVIGECLSKSRNITQLTTGCYKTYENYTWWLNPKDPLNTHRYCKAAKRLFRCLDELAREKCGDAFTDWVWKYQERLWSYHLRSIDCLVGSKISRGELTMISLCGATTALCGFFAILSCVFKPENKITEKKLKKKKPSLVHFGETNKSYTIDNSEMSEQDTERQNVITFTKSLEITKM